MSKTPSYNSKRTASKVLSSIIVPLLIGVATVLISVVQLQIASKQRNQDLQIATERREQDSRVADNLQKDLILAAYIEHISELALSVNFTLNDTLIANICRAKTLIALRQLDAKRRSHLIKFLYAADMIRYRQPHIRLADAELNDIDLSVHDYIVGKHFRELSQVPFRQTSLNNASFANRLIVDSDFEGASMIGANFTNSRFSSTSFVGAVLRHADFTNASSNHFINFQSADLFGAMISDEMLRNAISIEDAVLPNGTLGVRRNILVNSDAESPTCEVDTSLPAPWRVERISGNVSLSVNGYRSHANILPVRNITESIGQCFFAARGREGEVMMRQEIPRTAIEHMPVGEENVSLVVRVLCGPVSNYDQKRNFATIHIAQIGTNGISLHNYTRDVYTAGSYTKVARCDPRLQRLLFTITFVRLPSPSTTNESDDAIFYVCDNLRLSLLLK